MVGIGNPKTKRLRNLGWLKKVRDIPCVITGNPEGNDPAHIRYGFFCAGDKPDDNLVLPVRHDLHATQHQVGEVAFWRAFITKNEHFMMEAIKCYARELYRKHNEKD